MQGNPTLIHVHCHTLRSQPPEELKGVPLTGEYGEYAMEALGDAFPEVQEHVINAVLESVGAMPEAEYALGEYSVFQTQAGAVLVRAVILPENIVCVSVHRLNEDVVVALEA